MSSLVIYLFFLWELFPYWLTSVFYHAHEKKKIISGESEEETLWLKDFKAYNSDALPLWRFATTNEIFFFSIFNFFLILFSFK